MRAGRNTFIVALLVLVAGLLKGSQSHVIHVSRQTHPGDIPLHVSPQHLHLISVLAQDQPADHTRHGEKRHGKSLVSQAIVADCPVVVRPGFTYCHHNYSLFLPGGCSRQYTGNFSLRGPPALC
jgi:hypothetical protein